MKKIRLNNIIFPIWFLLFFPPVIFMTLIGNFVIDSVVVIGCFYVFKVSKYMDIKTFYKKSILKVWVFGFFSDIIGAAILLLINMLGDYINIPYELIYGISYDPFSNLWAVLIIIFCIFLSGFFIWLLNYKITFKHLISDTKLRFKIALTIAIITLPWTFLLPTNWFY